ncbi:MAG TPA: hypothetical protein VMI94_15995 [Bryobacteraceae bacterium]|nr:hypothetical protein [Bryobacteraceae bacterium]
MRKILFFCLALSLASFAQAPPVPAWKFAVSGDSRNCGDIVMPAIAAGVLHSGVKFYWHLGDFRAIYDFDEDTVPPASLHLNYPHLTIISYLLKAWPDFIDRQLKPFGDLEIFLGIGNHELIFPETREAYLREFEQYLDSPRLRAQRAQDKDEGGYRTYYHWVMNGAVDFISLDNASGNTFDKAQLDWVRKRLADDKKSRVITTVVLGAHEALPGSKGMSHSMCDSAAGIETGREVYNLLWDLRQAGKKVYVLASHSHFVMDDVYNTSYWEGRVLPGWIVGTAGAVRYRLPAGVPTATIARTDVYGYLLGTVMTDGTIRFAFNPLTRDDLRRANAGRVPAALVDWCYAENSDKTGWAPHACEPPH